MTDYRALLADELMRNWPTHIWNRDAALITVDNMLAKVPELKGAPTIARLLAIGEAVWTARKEEQ